MVGSSFASSKIFTMDVGGPGYAKVARYAVEVADKAGAKPNLSAQLVA